MRPLSLFLSFTFLITACGSSGKDPLPQAGADANTSDGGALGEDRALADSAASQDGAMSHGDGSMTGHDGGMGDALPPVVDAGPAAECTTLGECCPEVPAQLAPQCADLANSADGVRCSQILGFAQNLGFCMGGADAGPLPDGGPMGPSCGELDLCCPELGQLERVCQRVVGRRDENTCRQTLQAAQSRGTCGGLSDAGTSSTADAGPELDAGTSTTADSGA